MTTRKGAGKASKFSHGAPWRALSGEKPIPRIAQSPSFLVRQGPQYQYATSVMKHPDPIGLGLATDAFVEAAGPECIVPGQQRPIRVLGLQVWPLPLPNISLKALEPLGRELKTFGKFLDRAFDLMQAPFAAR